MCSVVGIVASEETHDCQTYTLLLEPQSSVSLAPKQANGITQTIRLNGVQGGQGGNVKMRWKAAYHIGGVRKDEQGEIASLGIS